MHLCMLICFCVSLWLPQPTEHPQVPLIAMQGTIAAYVTRQHVYHPDCLWPAAALNLALEALW